jgi:hypothetical protein
MAPAPTAAERRLPPIASTLSTVPELKQIFPKSSAVPQPTVIAAEPPLHVTSPAPAAFALPEAQKSKGRRGRRRRATQERPSPSPAMQRGSPPRDDCAPSMATKAPAIPPPPSNQCELDQRPTDAAGQAPRPSRRQKCGANLGGATEGAPGCDFPILPAPQRRRKSVNPNSVSVVGEVVGGGAAKTVVAKKARLPVRNREWKLMQPRHELPQWDESGCEESAHDEEGSEEAGGDGKVSMQLEVMVPHPKNNFQELIKELLPARSVCLLPFLTFHAQLPTLLLKFPQGCTLRSVSVREWCGVRSEVSRDGMECTCWSRSDVQLVSH